MGRNMRGFEVTLFIQFRGDMWPGLPEPLAYPEDDASDVEAPAVFAHPPKQSSSCTAGASARRLESSADCVPRANKHLKTVATQRDGWLIERRFCSDEQVN